TRPLPNRLAMDPTISHESFLAGRRPEGRAWRHGTCVDGLDRWGGVLRSPESASRPGRSKGRHTRRASRLPLVVGRMDLQRASRCYVLGVRVVCDVPEQRLVHGRTIVDAVCRPRAFRTAPLAPNPRIVDARLVW